MKFFALCFVFPRKNEACPKKTCFLSRISTIFSRNTTNSPHAKWATTDANRRSRATQQMYKYLNGELPRVPETAVETYKSLVDQGRPLDSAVPDMNEELGNKVDETRESINGLRQGNSALSDSLKALAEVAAVQSGIRLLSDSVNMVHRAEVHTNGHRLVARQDKLGIRPQKKAKLDTNAAAAILSNMNC